MKLVYTAPLRPPADIAALLPHLFLAGPIMGAERWQDRAVSYLQGTPGSFILCNPRREIDREEDFTDLQYEEQVDWETEHLHKAATTGCVLFWLAKEQEHFCHRAYAQTTRFELGEHFMGLVLSQRLVVGIEPGFSGERYLRHRFKRNGLQVDSELQTLCLRASEVCSTLARRQLDLRWR